MYQIHETGDRWSIHKKIITPNEKTSLIIRSYKFFVDAPPIPRLVDLVHAFNGVVVDQFKKRVEKLLSDSIPLWRLLKLLFKILQLLIFENTSYSSFASILHFRPHICMNFENEIQRNLKNKTTDYQRHILRLPFSQRRLFAGEKHFFFEKTLSSSYFQIVRSFKVFLVFAIKPHAEDENEFFEK